MDVWKVHAALPGLDVPFYIRSETRPTHEQINEVWLRDSLNRTPLKSSAETRGLPLTDCYPGYTRVERLEVVEIEAAG